MLAAWHASLEIAQPIANKEFLMRAFNQLGEHRREALRIAAGFRGDDVFDSGASEEQALDAVLPVALQRAHGGAGGRGRRALLLGPTRLGQLALVAAARGLLGEPSSPRAPLGWSASSTVTPSCSPAWARRG